MNDQVSEAPKTFIEAMGITMTQDPDCQNCAASEGCGVVRCFGLENLGPGNDILDACGQFEEEKA